MPNIIDYELNVKKSNPLIDYYDTCETMKCSNVNDYSRFSLPACFVSTPFKTIRPDIFLKNLSELVLFIITYLLNKIISIQSGETAIFEQVYQEHHENLYFFLFKKTGSSYIAEEVVQLTFIKLWNYRESLSVDIPIDVQIFRIAKTTLIDLLRKNASQRCAIENLQNFAPNQHENVVSVLVKKETAERIASIIEEMPPVRKKVFKLSREEGLTHKEIATQLSLTPKNVENHIAKAIRQLKKNLQLLLLVLYFLSLLF